VLAIVYNKCYTEKSLDVRKFGERATLNDYSQYDIMMSGQYFIMLLVLTESL
jgi:hypothetical protein